MHSINVQLNAKLITIGHIEKMQGDGHLIHRQINKKKLCVSSWVNVKEFYLNL